MYRFAGLITLLLLAGCGGGSSTPNDPFGRNPTATNTPTTEVLGARNEPSSTATASPTAPAEYTVAAGDTLSEIAARFGTDTATLVSLNNLENPDALFVGQVLRITGAPATSAATATPAASASPPASPTQ